MLFRLVRPMKRSTSANAYFVQRIPADVKARAAGLKLRIPLADGFVDKTIPAGAADIRFSLKTADKSEVKVRQAAAAAYLEQVWRNLREANDGGPIRLRQDQIAALSGELYTTLMRAFEQDPGPPEWWRRRRAEIDEATRYRVPIEEGTPPSEIVDPERAVAMEREFGRGVDERLAAKALIVDADSRARLLEAAARVKRDVYLILERRAEGDYTPDAGAAKYPEWKPPVHQKPAAGSSPQAAEGTKGKTSITGILADWWREAQATGRKPSTYESYSNTVDNFVAFLGHDDATRVTPDDVVKFKDHRLSSVNPRTGKPISAKTVKDSDLSGLKTLFGWAVSNRRLPMNPATGVTIKLGKRKVTRPKGFTDDEAEALLKAADAHQQGNERRKTFAAKRWVPWLCAYTGARVGEVAQLRKEDVQKVGANWVIHISPEAGTVKTDQARDVVMHEHLVAKGFPTFVQSCDDGHLFVTPAKGGDVLGPLQGVKNRLAEFARETVTDPRVQPNHGWRHRFKTVARSVGMDSRVVDAIQGHAPRTAGDDYGDVTVTAMALAMAKFPRQV